MKRRIWLFSLFTLVLFSLIVIETYGLFETNAIGVTDFSVGKWIIKVNNEDISLSEEITLDDFEYEYNAHIEEGYFAPGSVGTLELEIDASLSDVALEYTIDFDTSALDDYPNISLTITDEANNQTVSGSYTGTIYVTDNNRVIDLLLSLEWENLSQYDESDTELIGSDAVIGMSVNFSQLLDEE